MSIMEATLWKKNLNFVKDEHMIYVNFIITGIIVYVRMTVHL